MAEIIYTASFKRDAEEVWDFIGQESYERADAVLDAVDETLAMLLDYPEAGRRRNELGPGVHSFLTAKRYLVYYAPRPDGSIVALRLLHTSRDVEGLF